MYRVMLVDDERPIREGLATVVDWSGLGFEVAAAAADGVEALERLDEAAFDLIIADIRMPRMDGLQLLAELRSRGNPVRFLVLSGFADFQYAQRASSLRIDGYLLKPVDEDELAARVAEVGRQLDASRFSALTLLGGVARVPDTYAWGRWQVLLLTAPDPEMHRRLAQACTDRGWGELFEKAPYAGVLLRRVYPRGHNLEGLARELASSLGPTGWFAAVGEVVTDAAAVPSSLQQAWALMADRFFFAPGTIAWQPRPERTTVAPDPEVWIRKLTVSVASGRPEATRAVLVDLAAAVSAWGDEAQARELLAGVAAGVVEGVSGVGQRPAAWISELWSLPYLGGLIDTLTARLTALVAGRASDPADLVRRLVELIATRYADNLKLDLLAEAFGYSADYLGKVFRQKTGQSFHTALEARRIEQAQVLLAQGLKVYQVAEKVGYRYVDYFHAAFRRRTGLSPTAFRSSQGQTHP
jgi:two-component system response regulator YesN